VFVKKNKKDLLSRYIREVIVEMTKADVISSTDPLDWLTSAYQAPRSWKSKNKFVAMKNAADEFGLKHLGSGSSRIVYELDKFRVVKMAMNTAGLEQNKLEVFMGNDPTIDIVLARVLDYSNDGYSWVVIEKVEPLSDLDERRAEELAGVKWSQVRSLFGLQSSSEHESTAPASRVQGSMSGGVKDSNVCLKGDDFLEAVKKLSKKYRGLLPGDLVKVSSWGINSEGCLVLLDYGITEKNYSQYYSGGIVKDEK